MFLEEHFIFMPSPYPIGNWTPWDLDPEDAWFHAADGTRLHGWYVPATRPRAVILFCHGNAGNVTHRDDVLRNLSRVTGASVLALDYRGYGRSEGTPTEQGVLADARAARDWLSARGEVALDRIVLMGESLGGAVAVWLAARDGARALVLENTFDRLASVASHHFPWLPTTWLLRTKLDSAATIAAYHGPLLQSHGDADSIVPYRLGQRLFAAANEPKEFLTIDDADHNDPRDRSYYGKLARFLDSLPEK